MTDPIADFLTQIKNGYMAHKAKVVLPYSQIRQALGMIMYKGGFIGEIKVIKIDKTRKNLTIELLYKDKEPRIEQIIRISKPGKRTYTNKLKIPKILGGLARVVLSTPQGLMFDKEAKKKGLGGEVICAIW